MGSKSPNSSLHNFFHHRYLGEDAAKNLTREIFEMLGEE